MNTSIHSRDNLQNWNTIVDERQPDILWTAGPVFILKNP